MKRNRVPISGRNGAGSSFMVDFISSRSVVSISSAKLCTRPGWSTESCRVTHHASNAITAITPQVVTTGRVMSTGPICQTSS
jgi:hypothetical protein